MGNKLPQAPKSPTKFWGIVIGVPLAFILTGLFMFLYTGSTKEIVAVADQFQPGSGWQLTTTQVEPPRIVCFNDVACPSVHRAWIVDEDISKETVKRVLGRAEWPLTVSGDCQLPANITGMGVSVCDASGVIKGYLVRLSVLKSALSSGNSQSTVVLQVNKE